MTIVPASRLSPAELLSLGRNVHAAVRNDHDHHRDTSFDDPVFISLRGDADVDEQVEAATESEHVAS